MTRNQALERINEVLTEIDALELERKGSAANFKLRRETLLTDLRMCRADVDQMSLGDTE